MGWKNQLTKTPYLVLFIVLITVGVGTASALITITLAGNVIVTGDLTGLNDVRVGNDLYLGDSEGTHDIRFFEDGNPNGERIQWDDENDQFEFSDDVAVFGDFQVQGDTAVFGDLQVQGNAEIIGPIISHRTTGGNSGNLIIERSGGPTIDNTQFVLSHRSTNKDMWIYGFDGTAFKNFVGFDYPNYKIRFPSTGDTLVVDAANDQVTIEGKGFETPWNSRVPSDTIITTVDSAGDVGFYTSITIGVDGNPVISYTDFTNTVLKLVHCTNASCITHDTPVTLDSAGNVGFYTSITIGVDGNPVISYADGDPNFDLKLVHCTNPSCSTHDTPVTLDSAGGVGFYTSITIGVDGNPVISYSEGNPVFDLKLVHCTNPSCSTHDTPVTLDSTGDVGFYTSITIGVDGNPVISYHDSTSDDLKLVHCTNASCSTHDTPVTLDSAVDVGLYTSITIGVDGNPVISYSEFSPNFDLKLVHCTNPSCSTHDTPVTLDSAGDVGLDTSITIGADGLPVISYGDLGFNRVIVAKCNDQSCVSSPVITIVGSAGSGGDYTSIAIGADGLPVISYQDGNPNFDLKITKCSNPYCIPNWIRR